MKSWLHHDEEKSSLFFYKYPNPPTMTLIIKESLTYKWAHNDLLENWPAKVLRFCGLDQHNIPLHQWFFLLQKVPIKCHQFKKFVGKNAITQLIS